VLTKESLADNGKIARGKLKRASSGCRMTQRFEQAGFDKNGNVMRSKTKKPRCFLCDHAGGLGSQIQKIFTFRIYHFRKISQAIGQRLSKPEIFREYVDNANQVKSGHWL
jgi:hypothetical protein